MSQKLTGMAGLFLLLSVFIVTFELGQTGVVDETESETQILKLFRKMVKLESEVKDIQNDNRKLRNDNRQLKGVIADLSNRLENESRLREQLEKRVRRCEICQGDHDTSDSGNDVIVPEPILNTPSKGKRISGIRSSNGTIAFSAYLATSMANPGNLRTIVFDAIFTNEGNGYNHHMGVFIAPRTGLYVFTWTIRQGGYFNTQLLVNGLIYGWMFSASNYHYDSNSATAVVRVEAGHSVFVRTGPASNSGTIFSGNEGFSTFSGWSID